MKAHTRVLIIVITGMITPLPAFVRIGHRGACGYEPENTCRSFQKALDLGVDMIELDVYRCKSNELVVIHDKTLERTTNGTGIVETKTITELKQLDAGKGEQIPTLEEVCNLINRRVIINIELKGADTALLTAELIHRYVKQKNWDYNDFIVSSFNHKELALFKQAAPEVTTSALLSGIPMRLAEFGNVCNANAIGISHDFITQEYVDDAHHRNLKVYVFTVNEIEDIQLMKSMGVDGIFSDYPDRLSEPTFFGRIEEISIDLAQLMIGRSWKPECPVPLHDLRYVTIAHWGYDDTVHTGHLIVHKKLAQEMLDIFEELFTAKFPIERMEIIDLYDADDIRSMQANNSSAFCCRANTTLPEIFSNHSYGIAIDINPLINPYVRGNVVLPQEGAAYVDRTKTYKGMITNSPDNACYQAFVSRGYQWGGEAWENRVDYQHFSKNIHDIISD